MFVRLFLLLLPIIACAADNADILQKKLNAIQNMQAKFYQTIEAKKIEKTTSSGQMVIARPNLLKWQITAPIKQLLIADGKKLWVYDEDLEQVSVKKQKSNIGGVASIFFGNDSFALAKDFDVQMTKSNHFDLKAKHAKLSFERVQLVFNDKFLTRIELFDELGQHTIVNLSKIKINSKLGSNLFKFKIPKGVDVVKQ
jgi:outer membrane lipoprotein carrier protein